MGQDWWVLTELWRSLRCPQPARSWVQAAFPKPELQCLKGNEAPRSDTYISWFLCLLPLLKQNWCCLLLKQLERDYLGIPHPKQIERDCLGFPQSTMLFMFSHFCLVCLTVAFVLFWWTCINVTEICTMVVTYFLYCAFEISWGWNRPMETEISLCV